MWSAGGQQHTVQEEVGGRGELLAAGAADDVLGLQGYRSQEEEDGEGAGEEDGAECRDEEETEDENEWSIVSTLFFGVRGQQVRGPMLALFRTPVRLGVVLLLLLTLALCSLLSL